MIVHRANTHMHMRSMLGMVKLTYELPFAAKVGNERPEKIELLGTLN